MPYIPLNRRPALDPIIEALQKRLREQGGDQGEVTYTVTRLALGVLAVKPSYKAYSTAIAALRVAADEIKRRCLDRYEDYSQDVNGDVVEFAEADNAIDAHMDESFRLKMSHVEKPLSGPVEKEFIVKTDGSVFVADSPLPQVAADQYQKLQEEIKETFFRR